MVFHSLYVNIRKFSFIAACFYLFSSTQVGAQTSLETLLDKVESTAKNTKSFKCDFLQQRHLSIFPKPVNFKGHLFVEKPDRLRWEFIDPIPSSLILKGSSGIKCERNGAALQFDLDSDPVMRLVAKQLWSWTGGAYHDLADDFVLSLSAENVLTMSPIDKSGSKFVSEITVRFDVDTFQPAQITIKEPGGDKTILFFTNFELDSSFSEETFSDCKSELKDSKKNQSR